jgi:hypothetical protein
MKVRFPLYATAKGLDLLFGDIFSRATRDRLRQKTMPRRQGDRHWEEPNPDPFPAPINKLLPGARTSINRWYVPDVVEWLRRHGFHCQK